MKAEAKGMTMAKKLMFLVVNLKKVFVERKNDQTIRQHPLCDHFIPASHTGAGVFEKLMTYSTIGNYIHM